MKGSKWYGNNYRKYEIWIKIKGKVKRKDVIFGFIFIFCECMCDLFIVLFFGWIIDVENLEGYFWNSYICLCCKYKLLNNRFWGLSFY